jgi:hypothetical protein
MQTIERRLRLESSRVDQPATEAVLTDLQGRVLSTASFHRTLCRSGQFDQVDFAVYLRLVASALSAVMGGGPDEGAPQSAGWALELPENSLAWVDDSCESHAPSKGASSLDHALQFVPKEHRAMAQRAFCAVAVVVPPTIFRWRSPESMPPSCGCTRPVRPGDVWIRLRIADDGPRVEVSFADRGLGLPRDFEPEQQSALGRQIALFLDRVLQESAVSGPGVNPVFEVAFVPTGRAAA